MTLKPTISVPREKDVKLKVAKESMANNIWDSVEVALNGIYFDESVCFMTYCYLTPRSFLPNNSSITSHNSADDCQAIAFV